MENKHVQMAWAVTRGMHFSSLGFRVWGLGARALRAFCCGLGFGGSEQRGVLNT